MALLSLFTIRLNRYRIPIILALLMSSLLLALAYRNLHHYNQLLLQERQRITSIKKDSETILYTKIPGEQLLSQQEQNYYEQVLKLANHYLDQEYRQGKSTAVLKTEKQLYQTLLQGFEQGHNNTIYTKNDLVEKVSYLSYIIENNLRFQHPEAPKDSSLFFLQILPISSILIPSTTLVICLWILLLDRATHYKFLFASGISSQKYANHLLLLAVVLNIFLYAVWIAGQLVIHFQFQFAFQADYPVLENHTLTFIPVKEVIGQLSLTNFKIVITSLIGLRLCSAIILRQKK